MPIKINRISLLAVIAMLYAGPGLANNPAASADASAPAAAAVKANAARPKNSPEYDQALAALDNRQLELAEKLFKQAALKQPKSPLPVIGLAEVARLNKNEAEAERLLRKAVEVDPKSPQSRLVLGAALFLRGKFAESEKQFLKAEELAPNALPPLLALADLYLKGLKDPAKAAEYFSKVLVLKPDYAAAHLGLGLSYATLKDYAKADASLDQARKLAPANPLPLMAQSQLQMSRGNTQGAITTMQEAGKLAPTMAEIPLRLGMYYQQEKQWPEAYAAYENAIRLNDKLVIAYNNLAWIAAERKERLDDAERWAARAVELVPQEPALKDTYAWVKRARGDHKGALELLLSITGSGNPPADFFYHLGIVREESGQKTEAVAAYKRALQINPKFPQADDARQRMEKLG
ncbi:MAG: tetratricopeptide repeat protein [Pseudomonadota bacterium]